MSATKVKAKRPPHRPLKLTPEIQDKICSALKIGCYIESAAAYADVTKKTLYDWLKRGNRQKRGIFRDFLNAVETAIEYGEAGHVQNVQKHSAQDWRASAWMLERKNPKRWGRREIVKEERPDTPAKDSVFNGDSVNAFIARELDSLDDNRWDDPQPSAAEPPAEPEGEEGG